MSTRHPSNINFHDDKFLMTYVSYYQQHVPVSHTDILHPTTAIDMPQIMKAIFIDIPVHATFIFIMKGTKTKLSCKTQHG